MSSGKEGIVKSLYGIINNKNGQWDPEKPKQRDFLLSQFNDGQFVYIQSHSFGEYSGNTDKNTKTTTTIFYADQHGISKVERINSKNERSLYWENTPDAILAFKSSRDEKKFRQDFNDRMECIDRRRVFDEHILSNQKSELTIKDELNTITQRVSGIRLSNPSVDESTLTGLIDSLSATAKAKLEQVYANRSELIKSLNEIPDMTSAEHKKLGMLALHATTNALLQAGKKVSRAQLDAVAHHVLAEIKKAHPQITDKTLQSLSAFAVTTQTLADLHERCHRPADQEYSFADTALQHLNFQRFADQVACILAIHDGYKPDQQRAVDIDKEPTEQSIKTPTQENPAPSEQPPSNPYEAFTRRR